MLHKLCVILAVILVVGAFAAPAFAQFTFDVASGDWETPGNWFPTLNAPPGEDDTATIPDGSTCTIDSDEAAEVLTIQDGGKVILQAGKDLTLGEKLASGNTLVIDDGGTLEIQGGSTSFEPYLYLYQDLNIAGDSAIVFPSGSAFVDLQADVTINGTGTLEGVCGGASVGTGINAFGDAYDLTISSGVTYKNVGRTSVGDFINYGTVEVSCVGLNEMLGSKVYGDGVWNMFLGELKTDDSGTEWSTPGDPGTFNIEGGTWRFAGTCNGFSDTLVFKKGLFTYRQEVGNISFRNCGDFTFGGDDSGSMVFEIPATEHFEVGGTCSSP